MLGAALARRSPSPDWRCRDINVPPTLRVSKSLVGGSCFLRMHYALVSRRAHFHRRTMVA